MPTARRTWQKCEQRVADLFGCKRQPGSGSGGRDDVTCSDSTHPRLFLETKLRATHAARSLHDATRKLAGKEGKTPVVCLADKNRPGFLVCVHSDDLAAVVVQFCAAHPELHAAIITAIREREGIEPDDILPPRGGEG